MESPETDHRPEEQNPRCAGVPRQFSVGGLLLIMTSFAGFFGLLAAMGLPPIVFGFLAVYVAGVCAGQMFLFKGERPREASLVVGSLLFVLFLAVAVIASYISGERPFLLVLVVLGPTLGAGLGYVVGGAVAGVFLSPLAKQIHGKSAADDEGQEDQSRRKVG